MKRSTGLRNHMLASGSFKDAVNGTVLRVYSGTAPASADDAIGAAVLLCTISVDGTGTGVTLDASASGGVINKNPSEVWTGDVTTSGTASFFRMEFSSDTGAFSTSAARLQGTVGLVGADLNFSSVSLTAGDARRVNYFAASISAG